MVVKEKKEIEIAGGVKVFAQTPIIVSASRSTDIPAFYSDWFHYYPIGGIDSFLLVSQMVS